MTLLRASFSPGASMTLALGFFIMLSSGVPLRAEGIPEPSVVYFGKITMRNTLVEQGSIQMTFVPAAGGQSVTVAASLSKIASADASGESYSYKVKVPLETVMYGMSLSGNTLPLSDNGKSFARTVVITAAGGSMTFQSPATMGGITQRGTAQRLDFDVTGIGGSLLPGDIVPVILGQKSPQDIMDLNSDQAIDAADIIRSAAH